MHLALAVILPLLITVGSGLLSFYVIRQRTLVALANERMHLAKLRAEADAYRSADQQPNQLRPEVQSQALGEYSGESGSPARQKSNEADAAAGAHSSFRRVLRRATERRTIGPDGRAVQDVREAISTNRTAYANTSSVYDLPAQATSRVAHQEETATLSRLIDELQASAAMASEGSMPDQRAMASYQDAPAYEDHQSLVTSVEEVNWTESECYTESTYSVTTSAADYQESETYFLEEGTQMSQMTKPTLQQATQSPIRSSEDQRLTHKLSSTVGEWSGSGSGSSNEPAPDSVRTSLQTVEDIYMKSNFQPTTTTAHWHILKVADMLNSDHLRGLSAAAKHSALLMALEAAGVAVEDVLQDAVQRQRVLNEYEQAQQARLQQLEAIKLRESERLTAEMETIKSQYQARITAVLEDLERERTALRDWQAKKEAEQRRIADASSCVSLASNETNVRFLIEANSGARLRESA